MPRRDSIPVTGPPDASSPDFVTEASRFFAEINGPLVGALSIRTGDRATAEDIAQEAIARAWADWENVGLMANPRGWVFRVGFNLASSHWRRLTIRRRAERREAATAESTVPGPDLTTVDALTLDEALRSLSRRQQEVVILRHFVHMSVAETAEVLGISEGTVKTQTHRALASLRVELEVDDAHR